ncbi:EcsC family protein [Lacinutrix venerupis]|uniref:EcsC family protein n=1 Tax=Lacinutrix venerupis TaxID=1486034 RepID=UPI000EB18696|nr:EcsC family protein [Lacinutrix venerupis]RLJ61612.1 EcsC family protein [Lacinutrix venerupis]
MSEELEKSNNISHEDLEALKNAKSTMNNISWAMRNANKIGSTVETGATFIPEKVFNKLQKIMHSVLLGIIKVNLKTIKKNKTFSKPSNKTYRAIVTGSGALSGFLGSTTGVGTAIFASELTLTTKFLMRTIMDIARSEGEDIYSIEGQMACLEVFALGGESKEDDGLETSYYTTRVALSSAIQNVTAQGINSFVSKIVTRWSIQVTEKFVAQAVPVLGAVGGGSINYIFINHFQNMATAHFTIKRLERKYGKELIEKVFKTININTIDK